MSTQDTIRQAIVGRRLSGVTFVLDYVQLQFDPPPIVSALTPITVCSQGRTAVSGDQVFRNLLCEQIGKTVTGVSHVADKELIFKFEDASTVSLSLLMKDYSGAEAVIINGENHLLVVI